MRLSLFKSMVVAAIVAAEANAIRLDDYNQLAEVEADLMLEEAAAASAPGNAKPAP